MPRLPKLRIDALDRLAGQLRYAPPEAARRQLIRAEELVENIEPGQTYPEDWVIYRITGYRTEDTAEPSLLVGEPLLADLGALIERLSVTAGITAAELRKQADDDDDDAWLEIESVCDRFGVSRKTVDRYRRRGLIARRVIGDNGRHRLMFSALMVARFEATNGDVLERAREFSRIETDLEEEIIRRAGKYRHAFGWSLNHCAQRLSERFDRGHETIRQLLRRHDSECNEPIFDESGPLNEEQTEQIEHAWRSGIDVEEIATKYERTKATVYRVIAVRRADRLRALRLRPWDAAARLAADEASRQFLSPKSVTNGLQYPEPESLAALLARPEPAPRTASDDERDRVWAMRWLMHQAWIGVGELHKYNPSSAALDDIESALRWASLLKMQLVRGQEHLVIKTAENVLGSPLAKLPKEVSVDLIDMCYAVVIKAVETFDPKRGGRLAAPVGLALGKALTAWARGVGEQWADGGAKNRDDIDANTVTLKDWTARVHPWQEFLALDTSVRAASKLLNEQDHSIVQAHYGLNGKPPRTHRQIAETLSMTAWHVARREHAALRAAAVSIEA